MRTLFNFTIFLALCMTLCVFACNNSIKKNKISNTTIPDTVALPPPEPPHIEIKLAEKKCFVKQDMNYKTTISIYYGGDKLYGKINSENNDSGTKKSAEFQGTISGDQYLVTFSETPPVIGLDSKWADKPWIIKKKPGKETLYIVFHVNTSKTHKWSDAIYEFSSADCK